MIYFAVANFDVVLSKDKKKVKKFAKRSRFAGKVEFGVCNRQTFLTPENFKKQFGNCLIFDLDQKVKFRADFSVCPDYSNSFA